MSVKRSRIKLNPEAYKNLRMQILTRDNWKCRVCKRRNNLHIHHIVFRSCGGDDADWNLITVCNKCHDAIHDRWVIIRQADSEFIDANNPLEFEFINGWNPRKNW